MIDTKIVEIGGEEIVVRELSVSQACALLSMLGEGDFQASPLDVLMDRPFHAVAVSMSCGIDLEDIEARGWPLSALEELYDAFAAVNPTFLAAMKRLAAIGKGLAGDGSEISAGQPAS